MKKLIIATILFFGASPLYAAYIDNGNGTVTDSSTGLMWQQETGAYMNWQNALDYCENLSFAGYSDWRLPTIEELRTLVDKSNYNPSIDINYFEDTFSSYYLSSSNDPFYIDHAWGVYFYYGSDYSLIKTDDYYVRAVRLGQVGNSIISITPEILNIPKETGNGKFNVSNTGTGTMNWTASVALGSDWLTITSGAIGVNNGTINFTFAPNTATSKRTGKIKVTASGATISSKEVAVIQAAGEQILQFRLTVNTIHGVVNINPKKEVYNLDEIVTLTAKPDGGYKFTGWSGDASGTTADTTVTMTGNKTVTANFELLTYSLSVETDGKGSVTKNPDKQSYSIGETVSLTATSEDGYKFKGWSGDASGTESTVTITMTGDKNVKATFATDTPLPLPVPAAPTLTATVSGINVSLSWTSPQGADGYTLFYATYTGADPQNIDISAFASADLGTTNQFSASLFEGAAFYVAVKAYNKSGEKSELSNVVPIIIEKTTPEPEPEPETETSSGMGKAIILAGGGATTTLYPYSNKLCQQMYRLLKQRGFTDDDILYMNQQAPDIDEDGYLDDGSLDDDRLDYTLFEPENDLKSAFAKAASGVAQGGQFILYVHGHADKDFLKITREYEISASQLKELLGSIPAGVQQLIILDTCYSGSFLDELSGVENRIVITSADDNTVSWNVEVGSFSDKFIRTLRLGNTLKKAFEDAEEMIKGSPEIFGSQSPWIDANADGVYSSTDPVRVSSVYLGKEGVQAAEPPVITRVHPVISIPEGSAAETLWVETSPSGDDRIKMVKAVLMPPGFSSTEYKGEDTIFSSEKMVQLEYSRTQKRYEVVYDSFQQPGKWRIVYQVQGSDGEWSDIVFGEVNAGGINKAVYMSVKLNQEVYQVSEDIRFDITMNGKATVDLYVGIIYPRGYLQTFAYPQTPSLVDQMIPYQSNITVNGQYPVNTLPLPITSGWTTGKYSFCAAANEPLSPENWYIDCEPFEIK